MSKSNFVTKISGGWKIILFFLIAASLLAIKYNYFSAKYFRTTAEIKTVENKTGTYTAVINAVNKQKQFVEYFQIEPLFKTELYTSSPITVSYSLKKEKFYKQDFEFKYSGNNAFVLTYEHNGIERSRQGEFGKEIHETDLNFTVNKNSELIPARCETLLSKNLQFIIYSDKALAETLLKNSVDISSGNGTTTITVTNTVPEKTMNLANEIAVSFSEQKNSSGNLDLIHEQLAKVAMELDNAQAAVAKYKTENAITEFPLQADAQLNHLENLELQKMNLQMQTLALDNLSDYMRQNRTTENAAPEYGTITDPVFADYITKLNEKISTNKTQYDNQNSTLNTEINFLKNTIAEGIRNTRKKTALQTDEINKQIALAKSGFGVLPEKESQLQTLNRNLYLVEKLYNYLVDKRTEAMYAGAIPFAEDSSKQVATLPRESINMKANTVWILAILFGLLTGCICTLIAGNFKRLTITNRKIIDDHKSIPFFASIENRNNKEVTSEFGNICTKLLLLRNESQKHVITVTSANQGDGKTFFVSHLAKTLAASDLKVLMITMNVFDNSLEKIFDIEPRHTLAEVVQKKINLQEAISITAIPDLDVLVGGEFTNGTNSLLINHKMGNIFNEFKQHYDFIIIDSPDTNSSLDAVPLMKLSDTNLFITPYGSDTQKTFEIAENIRSDYKIENLFFVLNMIGSTSGKGNKATLKKSKIEIENNNNQSSATEATPFLKKVAMWFY
ncbi:MAG: AAA family ATPase [Bacteroidia bacterium]